MLHVNFLIVDQWRLARFQLIGSEILLKLKELQRSPFESPHSSCGRCQKAISRCTSKKRIKEVKNSSKGKVLIFIAHLPKVIHPVECSPEKGGHLHYISKASHPWRPMGMKDLVRAVTWVNSQQGWRVGCRFLNIHLFSRQKSILF